MRCAYGQRPSGSPSPVSREEFEKQKELLGKTLDRLADALKVLDTVAPLVDAIKQERLAMDREREAAKQEREAYQRTIALGDKAVAAEAKVNETYEKKLVPAYDKLVDKQAARIEKLEDKVDKANKRTVWGILGGFLGGVFSKL